MTLVYCTISTCTISTRACRFSHASQATMNLPWIQVEHLQYFVMGHSQLWSSFQTRTWHFQCLWSYSEDKTEPILHLVTLIFVHELGPQLSHVTPCEPMVKMVQYWVVFNLRFVHGKYPQKLWSFGLLCEFHFVLLGINFVNCGCDFSILSKEQWEPNRV